MDTLRHRVFYGDRQLSLHAVDLLSAPVEVIVVEADSQLTQSGPLIRRVIDVAGDEIPAQMRQLIHEYGDIEPGMALYTAAGNLPFHAIIHAVIPGHAHAGDLRLLEQAVSRSLQLCDMNEWASVAFPALGLDNAKDDEESVLQSLHRAVLRFWDARQDCYPKEIVFCLSEKQCGAFTQILCQPGETLDEAPDKSAQSPDAAPAEGYVELSDEDIAGLDDTDLNEWFK